ncbi:cytochrome c oxidase cbb3-type subunit IV [Burkholderiaceae bacterium]|nr:cytochrome c oxidase cbb3-type subunit IV [Burkholderiaceae bacterium]
MQIDINDIRSLVTLLGLMLFVALLAWTWWPARKAAHEAAAQLPFLDEQEPPADRACRDKGEMR